MTTRQGRRGSNASRRFRADIDEVQFVLAELGESLPASVRNYFPICFRKSPLFLLQVAVGVAAAWLMPATANEPSYIWSIVCVIILNFIVTIAIIPKEVSAVGPFPQC
jgi:hypothetical protein